MGRASDYQRGAGSVEQLGLRKILLMSANDMPNTAGMGKASEALNGTCHGRHGGFEGACVSSLE